MALYENIAEYYDEIFPLKQSRLDFIDSFLKKGVAPPTYSRSARCRSFVDVISKVCRKKGVAPPTYSRSARCRSFRGVISKICRKDKVKNNLKVLDIGCATGELALALAKKGHQVAGIDLDEKMIALARGKTKRTGLNTDFFMKDMTKIGEDFPAVSFDAVLCFGNTLVHLENPEKIKEVFIGIHKVLKIGGILMVQIVNYDRILSGGIKELPLLESENFIFRREYRYDKADHRIQFLTHLTIKKNGEVIKSSEILYPLTFQELKAALEHAGFFKFQFFGSETKIPYKKNSPTLIAFAQK
jgi:2-polyprenyl-3-methyl-5-hydroxy-6-metoxy-1,4-benzoquinol methylase